MRAVPWGKVLQAIRQGNVARLRILAEQAVDEEQHQLLTLLAEKMKSSTGCDPGPLQHMVAKLVSNSFRAPLGGASGTQHTIVRDAQYEAGPYSVKVRLEREHGAPRFTLFGQITETQRPKGTIGELPVALISGRTVLARASTNEFGEFRMECPPRRALRLYLPLKQRRKAIEVRFGGLVSRFLIACHNAGIDSA